MRRVVPLLLGLLGCASAPAPHATSTSAPPVTTATATRSDTHVPLTNIDVGDPDAPLASIHEAKLAVPLAGKNPLGVYANRVWAMTSEGLLGIPLDGSPAEAIAAPRWMPTPRLRGSLIVGLTSAEPSMVVALDESNGRSFTLGPEKEPTNYDLSVCRGDAYVLVQRHRSARVVDLDGHTLFTRDMSNEFFACTKERLVLISGAAGAAVRGLEPSGAESWKADVSLPGSMLWMQTNDDAIAFVEHKATLLAIDTKTGTITRTPIRDGRDAKLERFVVDVDAHAALVRVRDAKQEFLELVDLHTGALAWSAPTRDNIEGASLTEDAVVVTDSDSRGYNELGAYRVVVLDRASGHEAWSATHTQIGVPRAEPWTSAKGRLVGIAVLQGLAPSYVFVRGK